MKYVFWDTETTGLTLQDEVIQMAGIVTDTDFKMEGSFNFYCETAHPISKKAASVNKLSYEVIHKLSNGLYFEDQFYDVVKYLGSEVCWISWSTNGFDERLVRQTLNKVHRPLYDFGTKLVQLNEASGVCNLNAMRVVCREHYKGSERPLSFVFKDLIGELNPTMTKFYMEKLNKHGRPVEAHDAMYDSFIMYLLMLKEHKC